MPRYIYVLYTGYENDVDLFETLTSAMTFSKREPEKWRWVEAEKQWAYTVAEDTGEHGEGGWMATIVKKKLRS